MPFCCCWPVLEPGCAGYIDGAIICSEEVFVLAYGNLSADNAGRGEAPPRVGACD